ncbi:putative bifunctional diguanylate cyclase/phosphodiesterase [Ideonella livida]|uniref:EAL domain-containing protein n=1 Tax=Ideonella livida TaxID=2707176 RepID=A0A7C9TKN2_9BURK|nr:EAL domain-containing protein [Ideonella livida]NDY92618.1 EAL domain-containing protein [Ideonella livida]
MQLPVLLVLAAVVAVLGLGPRAVADRLMAAEGEDAAYDWAQTLVLVVPGLERLFSGRGFGEDTVEHLLVLRDLHDVFRFKFFKPSGELLLSSDNLEALGPVPVEGQSSPAAAGLALRLATQMARQSMEPPSDIAAEVARTRRPIAQMERGGPDRPALYTEAYVPVEHQGQVLGVVEVYVDQTTRTGHIQRAFAWLSVTVGLVMVVLGALGRWLWRQRMARARQDEEQARYLARFDPLSGTLNRSSFNEALTAQVSLSAQGGPGFAVLCVNLDHFKRVNDQFGLAAGDAVLHEVGERLRGLVRHGDQVARLGGDEFAILQSDVKGEEDVGVLAQRIIESLGEPLSLDKGEVPLGCSVGAALWGVDARDVDGLMHKADMALYRAKCDGRGTFSFYDARLDQQLQDRRDLTRDLGQAIAQQQLALHFQPLFCAEDGALTGYEALARWPHPQRGFISPAVFISLAEESGLIEALGGWVLRQACTEAAQWPAPLTVAVNLSAAQFRRGDLVGEVRQCLQETGLPPERLELEVTESLLIGSPEAVADTLKALTGLGVRIAMDDFGTGYSSLAYLWRFPFHKLKIDRAFTQHLENDPKVRVIVRSIISLAHSLDIRVNAEGVETDGQRAALQGLGCDELQGFLLGRPAPVEALTHRARRVVKTVVEPAGA